MPAKRVWITCDCRDNEWSTEAPDYDECDECDDCGEPATMYVLPDSPQQFTVECWWAAAPDGIRGAGHSIPRPQVHDWKELDGSKAYRDWVALPLYRKHK